MAFKTEALPAKQKRIYSFQELYDFDKKVQALTNEKCRIDWDRLYRSEGAMNPDGSVICHSIDRNTDGAVIGADIPMNELQNLITQWDAWERKRSYSEERKIAQLDRMAIHLGFRAPEPVHTGNTEHADMDLKRIAAMRQEEGSPLNPDQDFIDKF